MQKSNILTPTSKVVEMIIRRIPSFDLLEFEKEVNVNFWIFFLPPNHHFNWNKWNYLYNYKIIQYIFRQAMGFYFEDDLEQLKKIAADQALALMTGEIKSRVDRVYYTFMNWF